MPPPLTIEYVRNFILNKNGILISEHYKTGETKLEIKCDKGHIFSTIFNRVRRGDWCPFCCFTVKKSFEEVKNFVESKDAILISTEYINIKTKMKIQCKNGHIFNAAYDYIKRGRWCPHCAKKAKLTIEILQEVAKSRSGKLISDVYIDNKQKLIWECEVGHIFTNTAHSIKNAGTWCDQCKFSTESLCREFFENYFGLKFPKIRPKWLRGFKNRSLELDGYCEELNLAFEFNGRQHYFFVPAFHKDIETFENQQKRDKLKIEKCKANNTKLIIIPYTTKRYEKDKLFKDLEEILKKEGY